MQARITTVGSNAALRIPAHVLREWGAKVGDTVEVVIERGVLVAKRLRPTYTLEELLAQESAPLYKAWLDDGSAGEEVI